MVPFSLVLAGESVYTIPRCTSFYLMWQFFFSVPIQVPKSFTIQVKNGLEAAYLEHFDNITCAKHFVHDHKLVGLICREMWGQNAVRTALSVKQPACGTR